MLHRATSETDPGWMDNKTYNWSMLKDFIFLAQVLVEFKNRCYVAAPAHCEQWSGK